MASVVIVHAAEDALPARALAEKLARAGMKPVFDMTAGVELREAIRNAAAVMALWSPRSINQFDLVGEARFAAEFKNVIHARMQNAPCPEPFAAEPAIDLTGWRGEDDFPAWRSLARAIAEAAGLAAPASAPPRQPGGFFAPGASAPAPAPAPSHAPAQGRAHTPVPPPASAPAFANPAPAPQRPHAATAASRAPGPESRFQPIDTAPAPEAERRVEERPAPAMEAPMEAPRQRYDPPPVDYAYDERPERRGAAGGFLMGVLAAVLVMGGLGGVGYFFFLKPGGGGVAWERVDRDDPYALRAFLKGAQPGPERDEASAALDRLEARRLGEARSQDNVEAYQAFLAEFPESAQATAVRGRIAELRLLQSSQPAEGAEPGAIDPLTGQPIDPNAPPAEGQEPGVISTLPPIGAAPGADNPPNEGAASPYNSPYASGAPYTPPASSNPSGPIILTPQREESETPDAPEEPAGASDY